MAIEIRVPGDDDVDALFHADARAFGFHYTPERTAENLMVIDLSRFRVALDGDEIVGVIGSYALDVTLPGGATVPMGGVTWVGVAATHRRQGLLRRLIDACHDDIDDRGEPVAMLFASEGGIYERFGYGVATRLWMIEIDKRAAELRPELVPAPGSVRFVRGDEADRARRQAVGALPADPSVRDQPAGQLAGVLRADPRQERHGASPAWFLAHDDGYAIYRMRQHWNDGRPSHVLDLERDRRARRPRPTSRCGTCC